MRKLSEQEVRKIQLEILDVTASFCDAHRISYFLAAGSLLGAVRHNGYIPWDDDIDLGMLRADFDIFLQQFNKENDRYKAFSVDNNRDFLFPWIKVIDTETVLYEPDENGIKLAVNIDIFPHDNAPAEKEDVLNLFHKARVCRNWLNKRLSHGRPGGNLVRRIFVYATRPFMKIIPRWYFVKKISDSARAAGQRYTGTGRIADFTGYTVYSCKRESLEATTDHVFEGKMYKIPVGYDDYLKALFGNYMELPPPEKRVTHHSYVAYRIDEKN